MVLSLMMPCRPDMVSYPHCHLPYYMVPCPGTIYQSAQCHIADKCSYKIHHFENLKFGCFLFTVKILWSFEFHAYKSGNIHNIAIKLSQRRYRYSKRKHDTKIKRCLLFHSYLEYASQPFQQPFQILKIQHAGWAIHLTPLLDSSKSMKRCDQLSSKKLFWVIHIQVVPLSFILKCP